MVENAWWERQDPPERRVSGGQTTTSRVPTQGAAPPSIFDIVRAMQAPQGMPTWQPSTPAQARVAQLPGFDEAVQRIIQRPTPQYQSPSAPSSWAEAGVEGGGGVFNRVTDFLLNDTLIMAPLKGLDAPRSAVMATVSQGLDAVRLGEVPSISEWMSEFDDQIGAGDLLEEHTSIENMWVKRTLGLAGDLALDPTMYIPSAGLVKGGRMAFQFGDDVARIITKLDGVANPQTINALKQVQFKMVRRGGTALTANEQALFNVARAAAGMSDTHVARGLASRGVAQTPQQLVALADRAAGPGLNRATRRIISKSAEEAYKPGGRMIIPGTGRVARGTARALTAGRVTWAEKTIPVMPQALTKFTPRGAFQAVRHGIKGSQISSRVINHALDGDYTLIKRKMASNDPDEVADGFLAHQQVVAGRNSRQALAEAAAYETKILDNRLAKLGVKVPDEVMFEALEGSDEAMAQLGPEARQAVEEFRSRMWKTANEMAKPDEDTLALVSDPKLREALESDYLPFYNNWSPLVLGKQARQLIEESADDSPIAVLKDINPRNAPAKIKDGEEFLGRMLYKTTDRANNPYGLTPRQQADAIWAEWMERTGHTGAERLFSTNWREAVHQHFLWQAENVARERTIRGLMAHGKGAFFEPEEVEAASAAAAARGRRRAASKKALRKLEKRADKRIAEREKEVAAAQAKVEEARKTLRARQAEEDFAKGNLERAQKLLQTAEGIEEAMEAAYLDAYDAAVFLGKVTDDIANANGEELARLLAEIDEAQEVLDRAWQWNDVVYGAKERARRSYENAVLEAEAAHRAAAEAPEKAHELGRRLAEIDVRLNAAEAELLKWESANIPQIVHDLDALKPKLAKAAAKRERLRDVLYRYQTAKQGIIKGKNTGDEAAGRALGKAEHELRTEFGISNFTDGANALKKMDQMLSQGRQMQTIMEDQLFTAMNGRMGIETTRYYRDLQRVAHHIERVNTDTSGTADFVTRMRGDGDAVVLRRPSGRPTHTPVRTDPDGWGEWEVFDGPPDQRFDELAPYYDERHGINGGTPMLRRKNWKTGAVEEKPAEYAYRAMSIEEWRSYVEQGYIQGLGRANAEGTGTAFALHPEIAVGYMSRWTESGASVVMVRVRITPDEVWENGWGSMAATEVRAHGQIPLDRVDRVSDVMQIYDMNDAFLEEAARLDQWRVDQRAWIDQNLKPDADSMPLVDAGDNPDWAATALWRQWDDATRQAKEEQYYRYIQELDRIDGFHAHTKNALHDQSKWTPAARHLRRDRVRQHQTIVGADGVTYRFDLPKHGGGGRGGGHTGVLRRGDIDNLPEVPDAIDFNATMEGVQAEVARLRRARALTIDEINGLPEPARVFAALEAPPVPNGAGRLMNQYGDTWTRVETDAMPNFARDYQGNWYSPPDPNATTTKRIYGETVTFNPTATTPVMRPVDRGLVYRVKKIKSKSAMPYYGGFAALQFDAVEALLRTKPGLWVKRLNRDWNNVRLLMRDGDTMEQAMRTVFGKDADLDQLVDSLLNGERNVPGATPKGFHSSLIRGEAHKAHKELAIASGHDAVAVLDGDRWAVMSLDLQVESAHLRLPPEVEDTVTRLSTEARELLDENARLADEAVGRIGMDIDELNGKMTDPRLLAERQRELDVRRNELADRVARGEFNQDSAGRRFAEEELAQLDRARELGEERARLVQLRQGELDVTQRNVADALDEVMRLEQEAAVAAARLARAQKAPMRIETWLEKLKALPPEQVEDALKRGWRQVGADGNMQLPQAFTDMIQGAPKMLDTKGFMRYVDGVTRWWKASAVSSPGFHIRNYLGGIINNFSAGVEMGAYHRYRKANSKFNDYMFKENMSYLDALDRLESEMGDIGKHYAAARRSGALSGGQFDELDFIETGGGNRFNPFSPQFGVFRKGRQIGDSVESALRGALAMDVLAKGGNIDNAIAAVHKFHFDYEDLSDFERRVMRRVIPFYTWTRKNLPLQLEMLVDSPRTFQTFMSVKRNIEIGMEEEDILWSYVDKLNTIRAPWRVGGDALYLSPTTPFSDMTQMTDWRHWGSMVNPIFRAPIELAAGESVFTGAPFQERMEKLPMTLRWLGPALKEVGHADKDAQGNWMISKRGLHVVEQIPFLAMGYRMDPVGVVVTGGSTGERPDNRVAASIASFLFGLGGRVNTHIDQSNEMFRRARELDGPIQRARELGRVEEEERLRDEQQELLDIARALREEDG